MASSRDLLAAIIDTTEQAVVSVDLDGVVTSWNRGAEQFYGWSADEAVGRPLEGLTHPPGATAQVLDELRAGRAVEGVETGRTCRDGRTVVVGETTAAVRDADGAITGVATIARDITERIETQRLLEQYRRELDQRNQRLERSNADLEQFAYIASHDLSEPLRAIAGMVGLLGRRYRGQLDDDADEFIDFAVDGCARMRRMIDDLLTYSRVGRAELEVGPVDLGALVEESVHALRTEIADAGACVEHEGLPVVQADGTQLGRVLQNLLSNAVKYRRAGEPVRIEVTARRLVGDDGWHVEVSDDGIGIDPRYRERIFRMFQRLHTSEEHPGTGIGLAIAERIIRHHGGGIGITDSKRGGATFWFTLPDRIEAPS